MKIATYNLRNFYDADTFIDEVAEESVKEEFFNKRVAYFKDLFRKEDLDIICLQEVGGEKGVSIIGDDLGYNYFFAKPDRRGIRMAVLYKKSLDSHIVCESVSLGDLFIPSIQEEGDTKNILPIKQRRDVLVIDLDNYKGKKLRLVTFHLKSMLPIYLEGEDRDSEQKIHTEAKFRCIFYKMMELKGLRAFVDKTLDESREVILLGDFNEHNNGSGLDILKSSEKEERLLQDILVGYKGDATTHIHRGNNLTFDTMIVSQEIANLVESVSVLNDDLKCHSDIPLDEEIIGSDHAMVVLTLK
ncbi:endonuclease/exonuclease/phosphatase family protein [Candidatus Gracilibacteria bacterium]|nr:endonuclease/exonuclease/phosphatase family protein [Candidatus Gracilibacteria bacterium]MCF7898612.1 endonuclease/exonuclease/phosphatase family protein [Candidatus Paceibacterota bacterium]